MVNKNIKNIKGEKFNKLTVLEISEERDHTGCVMWLCECECGNKTNISGVRLRNGNTKSCGCAKIDFIKSHFYQDLTGRKFGRFTVLNKSEKPTNRSAYWDCLCDCGTKKEVLGENLRRSRVLSCGCLRIEAMFKMRGKNSPHYKNDLTDEHRILGRYVLGVESIKNWRESVFKKHDFTCICCGQKGGRLHAHHIDGWNWCVEKRFEVENGATLCKECHGEFHNKYGRGDNTSKQFNEFTSNKLIEMELKDNDDI